MTIIKKLNRLVLYISHNLEHSTLMSVLDYKRQ